MVRSLSELETFRDLIGEEGLDLMDVMVEVNPGKGKVTRPEDEKEDVIQI